MAQIAVDIENEARDGDIEVEIDEVGNRPVGKLSENSWFRDILIFTHDWLEIPIEFGASSTDANVPLSKKIPAVSVGGVTEAGRAHSQDEWIKCDKDSLIPVKRNMLLTYFASQYR